MFRDVRWVKAMTVTELVRIHSSTSFETLVTQAKVHIEAMCVVRPTITKVHGASMPAVAGAIAESVRAQPSQPSPLSSRHR